MIFFLLKASPLAAFACTGVVEGPPSLMTDGRPIVEKKKKKTKKKGFLPHWKRRKRRPIRFRPQFPEARYGGRNTIPLVLGRNCAWNVKIVSWQSTVGLKLLFPFKAAMIFLSSSSASTFALFNDLNRLQIDVCFRAVLFLQVALKFAEIGALCSLILFLQIFCTPPDLRCPIFAHKEKNSRNLEEIGSQDEGLATQKRREMMRWAFAEFLQETA